MTLDVYVSAYLRKKVAVVTSHKLSKQAGCCVIDMQFFYGDNSRVAIIISLVVVISCLPFVQSVVDPMMGLGFCFFLQTD